jgi:hypothetical protein
MHAMKHPARLSLLRMTLGVGLVTSWLLALQGCTSAPTSTEHVVTVPALPKASQARNAREYRQDAAHHLYARQAGRIYKGRLPPMLHAVGVLQLEIDREGQIRSLQWNRAPRHAPEVMAEIERMVRAAAPFPAPRHLAGVSYTDVWLWHQSGQFQLDTLTEGQD